MFFRRSRAHASSLRNMIRGGLGPMRVLDRLRGRISSASLKMGRGASRVMPSPTAWTISGLVFSLLAAAFFSRSGELYGMVAGLMVLICGFLDVVDGSVARATNSISKRGAFLDSTLDRVGEVAIYFGI